MRVDTRLLLVEGGDEMVKIYYFDIMAKRNFVINVRTRMNNCPLGSKHVCHVLKDA